VLTILVEREVISKALGRKVFRVIFRWSPADSSGGWRTEGKGRSLGEWSGFRTFVGRREKTARRRGRETDHSGNLGVGGFAIFWRRRGLGKEESELIRQTGLFLQEATEGREIEPRKRKEQEFYGLQGGTNEGENGPTILYIVF